jgi:hypothetical protein
MFGGMVIKRGVIHMLETLMPELSTQFAKIENNHAKIKHLTETIDKTQKSVLKGSLGSKKKKRNRLNYVPIP